MSAVSENTSITYSAEEESANTSNSSACKACSDSETNIVQLRESNSDLKEQLVAAQELAERYEKELSNERLYRKELESKLTALSLDMENKVAKCYEVNASFEQRIELLAKKQESDVNVMQNELRSAKAKYKSIEVDLLELNKRYQKLLGINRQKAHDMREQDIELPQTVDQLQFFSLQLREELIETRSAYEHSVNELKDELAIAREQMLDMEDKLRETERLMDEAEGTYSPHDVETMRSSNTGNDIFRYQQAIAELEGQITSMQKDRAESETALNEYKLKCATLQKELDTTEAVQKDFVKLSQELQIQLEKIRQAENEVRWQFEEDIYLCNKCENNFDNKRAKLHCLHCGKIFCHECLINTIPTGPNSRLAKVCDVCHTLLNRESIPYFSNIEEKQIQPSRNSRK